MKEYGIDHTSSENTTGHRRLIPSPIPGGENSGQDEFSEGRHEVHGPVEREQVEPLKPKSFGRFFVLCELALNVWTVCAGLKNTK